MPWYRRPPKPFKKIVASVMISVLATLKPGLGVVVLVTVSKFGIAASARELGNIQIYPVTMNGKGGDELVVNACQALGVALL